MGVTIKQLAEMAHVHRSTVDKVLHKRPGVSDEVRARVQRIIDKSGYQVNPLGRALSSQKSTRTIGAVLLRVDALQKISQGIKLASEEYSVFKLDVVYKIIDYPDVEGQLQAVTELIEQGVDGIIITPLQHTKVMEAIDSAVDHHIPVVTVNVDVPGKRLCYIGQDADKAGETAAHMMGLLLGKTGRVGIAVGSTWELLSVSKRAEGFMRFIREKMPDMTAEIAINTREDPETAYQETFRFLKAKPSVDGLFITCGCVPEICQAVQDAGRKDMAIICYERYPQIEELVRQGVISCTITSSLEQQGYQAVQVLFDRFTYDKMPEDARYMDIGILLKENL